jgi:hypothetical protein
MRFFIIAIVFLTLACNKNTQQNYNQEKIDAELNKQILIMKSVKESNDALNKRAIDYLLHQEERKVEFQRRLEIVWKESIEGCIEEAKNWCPPEGATNYFHYMQQDNHSWCMSRAAKECETNVKASKEIKRKIREDMDELN